MTGAAHVPVPVATDLEPLNLVAYFQEQCRNAVFRAALDLELQDQRAIVDSVKITEVELDDSGVVVSYDVAFSAYYGCRDQNYADRFSRTIDGTRVGANWFFKQHVPTPRRYPNEEL